MKNYIPIPTNDKNTGFNLCKCNKCDSILIDQNPQIEANLYTPQGCELTMNYYGVKTEDTDEDLKNAWVCPICNTDKFLTDL